MAQKKVYYPEIDICKGIGIVLVVMGHALKQTGQTNTVMEILLSVIYSFHMPLFFFLSGFVSERILHMDKWGQRIEYIRERAFRLLIPYFTVGLIYVPLKFYLSRFALKPYDFASLWRVFIGDNPNTALWFLYILFWIVVLSVLIVRKKNFRVVLGISFVLSALSYLIKWELRLPVYWFFYLAGIAARLYYEKLRGWFRSCSLPCLAAFAAANAVLFCRDLQQIRMVTALTGIVMCMGASLYLAEKREKCFLSLPGRFNMDIYIISEPVNTVTKLVFWNILHMNYLLVTVICFLAALLIPIPVSRMIIRRVRILRMGILGMK